MDVLAETVTKSAHPHSIFFTFALATTRLIPDSLPRKDRRPCRSRSNFASSTSCRPCPSFPLSQLVDPKPRSSICHDQLVTWSPLYIPVPPLPPSPRIMDARRVFVPPLYPCLLTDPNALRKRTRSLTPSRPSSHTTSSHQISPKPHR
jgi:hypothetical protein